MQLSFSHKKATQALNFFARAAGGKINKMKALKLIYFADRYHLRSYGRPITNDTYFAMKFGPVASQCLNLLNENEDYTAPEENKYRQAFLERENNEHYASKAAVNETVLSQTDLESLNYAWENYKDKDQFELAEETHRFPEWQQHKAALDSELATRRFMSYLDFLENPEQGVEKLPLLTEEIKEDLAEELHSLQAVESIWS
ncbi:hypothetical protein NT6N_05400 [Oceaniferula spumae]|uniref:Antitoxin SocA-like Panacea domain-containing protein n=1 Tax=Oceaniferula spumae TaxID=2979115 RepID=A0AAT9FHR3_9BACT